MRSRRQDAAANRDRILQAAQSLLCTNPEASMDDLARAAGVVRRTVYAHFPNRSALLIGLGKRVANEVLTAISGTDREALPPEVAFADFVLRLWHAGDHYRLLISLAENDLSAAALRGLLAPISAQGRDLLRRGQQTGRFATRLPVPVLGAALQSMTLAMLQAVNDNLWTDDGTCATTAVLIAAGVPARDAEAAVLRAKQVR